MKSAQRLNGIYSIVLEDYSAVASHTWSAKAYATINEVKTEIGSWDAGGAEYSESESYNAWAKKVIFYDGHYYELNDAKFAANAVSFSTTMGDEDAAHEITYTRNDDIAFYTEGEAWDTNSQITNSLVASAGQYVNYYNGTKDVEITDAGVYVMETSVLSRGENSGLRVYDSENSELAGFYREGTGFKQTARFYTSASSTIKVGINGGNTAGVDYVIIRKITEASDAIADCKTYETSAAFAAYIDGLYAAGSVLTAAQVYAAHTAWQIENASGNDLTKVILNADFGTGSLAPWTIYGDASGASADNDKYGVVEENSEGGYQYYTGWNGRNVSQNIYGLPVGVYRLTAKIYSWSGGAPVKLFANGTLSAEENGEDHEPSLEFTVTGSEESVKIGVGGVGQGSGDNTWGTWGYRVNYFTLTKVTVPATVTSVGYATFCNADYDLDFSSATDIEACKASVDAEGKITYTVVNTVAAGEGVLLRTKSGNAATESIPVVASATANENNAFVGIPEKVKLDQSTEYGYTNYILSKVDDVLGFYKVNANGSWCNAGTAYLKVADAVAPARGFFALWENETTGINAIAEGNTIEGQAYNLNGQRVAQPTKGLYIVNGKKVIIK